MKARNYCLALIAALALSAVSLMAQSSGATSGSSAPAKGSTATKSSTAASPAGSSKSTGKSSASSGSKLDINTATADQLKALPGIGDATAQKIIAYREQNGPFTSVEALDAIPGIGPARIADLKGLVVP